ncbi:MAG: ATP-binding protein [Ardenticatenaceae bacterium]
MRAQIGFWPFSVQYIKESRRRQVQKKCGARGLEPAEAAHIFDRFYRTDDSRRRDAGGTGLGLAIVKAIVEAHDGHVSATSQGKGKGKGKGCTFTIYLPLKPQNPPQIPHQSQDKPWDHTNL